jgi:hypothetical protein
MSYVTEADPEIAGDPLLEQMAALLETARREGYERGYADAVRRILEAASVTPQEGTVPDWRGMAGPSPYGPRRQRARRGSIEARIVEILGSTPEGASTAEIEAASADDDEPLKTPSIHATLRRLESAGRITRDGKRWRLAAPEQGDELPEDATGEEPATEPQALVAPETNPETM